MISVLESFRTDAERILRAAIEATDPYALASSALGRHATALSPRVSVIAAGKAAWPMAGSAVDVLAGRLRDVLVTGPADDDELPGVEHIDGEHPLPGPASVHAAARALEIARAAQVSDESLLVLLSGGASAMLAAPADGLTLEDKRQTTQALLRAGVDITALNCIRKHLSAIKGGRLAAAAGRCLTLAVSDVHEPPDDPATIGSGPTVADPTSYADALKHIERSRARIPPAVMAHLRSGAAGQRPETPKPGDATLRHALFEVVANRHTAMDGASAEARRLGLAVHVINRATRGEARTAGRLFAELGLTTRPVAGPICVIGSGETTVTVQGSGRGGRNQEFALAAAAVLASETIPALLVSVGTDGADGPTDAAGAVVDSTTVARAGAKAITRAFDRNDTYPLFARLGDLVKWGHTFTNVGDLHILITMGA